MNNRGHWVGRDRMGESAQIWGTRFLTRQMCPCSSKAILYGTVTSTRVGDGGRRAVAIAPYSMATMLELRSPRGFSFGCPGVQNFSYLPSMAPSELAGK